MMQFFGQKVFGGRIENFEDHFWVGFFADKVCGIIVDDLRHPLVD